MNKKTKRCECDLKAAAARKASGLSIIHNVPYLSQPFVNTITEITYLATVTRNIIFLLYIGPIVRFHKDDSFNLCFICNIIYSAYKKGTSLFLAHPFLEEYPLPIILISYLPTHLERLLPGPKTEVPK